MWRPAAWLVPAPTIVCMAGRLDAQTAPAPFRVLVGPVVGIYQTSHVDGAVGGFGGALGLERTGARLSLRALAGGIKTLITRGVGVCLPGPDCGEAVFPEWLLSTEIQALASAGPVVPLRLLGGAGMTVAIAAHENRRSGRRLSSSTEMRGTGRAGLELSLGRSPRAPRIQLTRSGYSKAIHSMNWLDALVILFPI